MFIKDKDNETYAFFHPLGQLFDEGIRYFRHHAAFGIYKYIDNSED